MTSPGPFLSGPQVEAWRVVYPALRQSGEIAVAERDGNDIGDLLGRLSTNPAFGSHGSQIPDPELGADLRERVGKMLEQCRSEVTTPIPEKCFGDQAIVCWWAHVTMGWPVKAVPRNLRDEQGHRFLNVPWKNPDKTVRERMWVSADWRPPKVTEGALAGLSVIVEQWQLEFGVSVATTPEHPSGVLRPLVGDSASFAGDVTTANGRLVAPGTVIEKAWAIRNTGEVAWEGRFLTRMGITKGSGLPKSKGRVAIKRTPPGATVNISVRITAPSRPGTYETYWTITDQHGVPFFPGRDDMKIVFVFVVDNAA